MIFQKLTLFLLVTTVFTQAYAREEDHEIVIDGTTRSYLLYIPNDLQKNKIPLMYVAHGGSGNAHHSSRTMGMNDVASKNQFIVAYPNGTSTLLGKERRVWNAGSCCAIAQRKNIDDVKFFDLMTKEILKKHPIDSKRIYITGESNGAMLSYRLMCDLPDVFAAAIPFSGSLGIDNCKAGQKVAFYDIHGSADKNVPYEGGRGKGPSTTDFRSIPESIKIITSLRQCKEPTKKTLPNGDIEAEYSCPGGAPVHTKLVKNGEHAWASWAAEEVWNFAKNYSR